MPIIYSYPKIANLETTDLFIISRTPQDPDEISNFSVDLQDISSYILTLLELDFAGDVGTGAVDFSPQEVFNIIGTSNEIETTANAQTLQIGLPDNVTITNNLIVGGTGNFTGQVTIPLQPIADTDAASKGYVDTAVTGLLDFKGTFRADTGEILSGVNAGSYLYNCPGGAGSRVSVLTGDYYIVANASGNFYCSGDLLNIGDSIFAVADAAADSSTINDWGIVESDNIEGSGTINTIPIWTNTQVLSNSIITQSGTSSITISGNLLVDNSQIEATTMIIGSTAEISGVLTMQDNIDMTSSGNIINLLDPVNAQDAATKSYVDALSDKHLVFTQALPSATWVITHNLNKFPSITVVDTANTVVYGEYVFNSINQTTLNFSSAFAGKAYLN